MLSDLFGESVLERTVLGHTLWGKVAWRSLFVTVGGGCFELVCEAWGGGGFFGVPEHAGGGLLGACLCANRPPPDYYEM